MSEQPRVALVSGGSRGIGRAIVREFRRAGWKVAFTYLGREDAARSLIEELAGDERACVAYRADVRDFERCGEVVEEVRKTMGSLDILVNNAGVKRDEPLYRMSPETWSEVIDTNLTGTFNFSRVAILEMIKRQAGCVINIVSVSGILGLAGQTNYAASKAGVIGFTKALSREVARFNIRVNAVAPGFIHTDMLEEIPEAMRRKLFSQIPSGSPGTAEQVAKAVRFLAGEDAGYITGQVLPVDGGMV
jgi:3-oxoacyl-[acyl-carrier protein] reductase